MTGDQDPHSQQLDQIIAAYLQAVEAGNAPSREQLLAEYPELAEPLKEFFTQHDAMQRAATGVRDDATIPPSAQPSDEATLAPNISDTLELGTRVRYFGDYELLEEIARGGMGVVYKARQVSLNRVVALKMILAAQLASEEDVQRFHAEAEAAANLDHPGIVPIHEVGVHDGQHYFSMGYVEGSSLAERIADGPLPPREAADLTKKVAEAVAYAHDHGVIHRDLKPANVLLDENGQPRVTDFGLAKRVEADSDLTRSGQILGTPSYMPPEQASGKIDAISEASDVYALGAILYCLLTGRPPFQADNQLDTLLQVLDQQPIGPKALNNNVPKDLDTVCIKCLEKDRVLRYTTALSLSEELGRFLNGEPILARPISAPARVWRWCKRKPVMAGLIGAASLSLLLCAYFAFVARQQAAEADREAERHQRDIVKTGAPKRLLKEAYVHLENLRLEQARHPEVDLATGKLIYGVFSRVVAEWDAITPEEQSEMRLALRNFTRPDDLIPDYEVNGLADDLLQLNRCLRRVRREDWVLLSPVDRELAERRRSTSHKKVQIPGDTETEHDSMEKERLRASQYYYAMQMARIQHDWENEQIQLVLDRLAATRPEATDQWDLRGFEWHYLYNQCHGELMVFEGFQEATDASYSPDGTTIVAGGLDGSIEVWNVVTGKAVLRFQGHSEAVTGVVYSPDGKQIASSSQDDTVKLWHASTGKLTRTLRGHLDDVSSVSYAPVGNHIYSGSGDGTVRAWNAATGDEVWLKQGYTLTGEPGRVTDVSVSPDGRRIAASIEGRTAAAVNVWNAQTGEPESRAFDVDARHYHRVAFSPDGKQIAWAGNGSARIWDAVSGRDLVRATEGTSRSGTAIEFSPDGKLIATALGRRVKLLEARTGGELPIPLEHAAFVRSVCFSPDGKRLVTCSGTSVKVWGLASGDPRAVLELEGPSLRERFL